MWPRRCLRQPLGSARLTVNEMVTWVSAIRCAHPEGEEETRVKALPLVRVVAAADFHQEAHCTHPLDRCAEEADLGLRVDAHRLHNAVEGGARGIAIDAHGHALGTEVGAPQLWQSAPRSPRVETIRLASPEGTHRLIWVATV